MSFTPMRGETHGTIRITRTWDGDSEEGNLPRPGFAYRWLYCCQRQVVEGEVVFVWGCGSQVAMGATHFTHYGQEASLAEARVAAEAAIQ